LADAPNPTVAQPLAVLLLSQKSAGRIAHRLDWGTGAALDIGPQSATGWLLAFSVLAAGILVGSLALL